MQKRIGRSGFGCEVTVDVAVEVGEHRVIFGMQQDHAERGLLQTYERLTAPVLHPCIEKEATGFVAGGGEHCA